TTRRCRLRLPRPTAPSTMFNTCRGSAPSAILGKDQSPSGRVQSDPSSHFREDANMDDPTRRNILKAGAAAAAMAAMPRAFAQQAGKGGTGTFYEKGPVRIRYEEAGAGFPLMRLPGGGLNAALSFFTGNSPFNAMEEFKGEYRCVTADLRNATTGQSTGPVEVDRPGES